MRGREVEADLNERAMAVTVSTASTDPVAIPSAAAIASPSTETSKREGAASIGRFLLLRKLGQGGMGEVYSGYDEQLDRKVAIKLLHAAYAPEETQKRMLREAQALARLTHPNVVAVHEVGQAEGDVFVVMEHIEGSTLRDWQAEPSRTVDEILQAYVQAGRGLAAVHAAGMIHRDFKPHNAMIDRQGRVRLLDFGLAHARGKISSGATNGATPQNALTSQLTADGVLAGTPSYMAPEQFSNEPLDARADQFSFCVALYQALYKELPHPPDWRTTNRFPGLATALAPPPPRDDIPARISEALRRGLSREPNLRFPNMSDLLAQLEIAPHADPSGQSRQRLLFALLVLGTMGAWMLAPDEFYTAPTVLGSLFLPALVMWFILIGGTFIFRNTLFRNPFHRLRISMLLVMGTAVLASRAVGVVLQDRLENVVIRDMLITSTGVALCTMVLVPRVLAAWVTLTIAIGGVIAVALFPQYLAEIATLTLNTAMLGYLVTWHRSAKHAPSSTQ
jgi:eukaryotic-like serine/threonine-protein kinase